MIFADGEVFDTGGHVAGFFLVQAVDDEVGHGSAQGFADEAAPENAPGGAHGGDAPLPLKENRRRREREIVLACASAKPATNGCPLPHKGLPA